MVEEENSGQLLNVIENLFAKFEESNDSDRMEFDLDLAETISMINLLAASTFQQTVTNMLHESLDRLNALMGEALISESAFKIWPEATLLNAEDVLRSTTRRLKSLPADYARGLSIRLDEFNVLLSDSKFEMDDRDLIEQLMPFKESTSRLETRDRRRYSRIKP